MYHSLSIKNFRGFRDFTLSSLGRVNLILGANNIGKTALLEAIFLLSGESNISLIHMLNAMRALSHHLQGYVNQSSDSFWDHLFHQFDVHNHIELQGQYGEGLTRQVKLALIPRSFIQINSEITVHERLENLSTKALQMTYNDSSGNEKTTQMFIDTQGNFHIESPSSLRPTIPIYILTACQQGSLAIVEESAKLFGELIINQQPDALLVTLQPIEPRLKRLIPIPNSSSGMIYGDIGLKKMLPLPLLGEGLNRLTHILLRMMTVSAHGFLLIDEIDNGLHYSTLHQAWKAIAKTAQDFDVQIFTTTHSWECIQAASEVFKASPAGDFQIHRLENTEQGIKAVTYDPESIQTSMEMNWEMR